MQEKEEKELIDFKQYFRILSTFWYVPIIVLCLAYFGAVYKIRYATPIYQVSGTLQVKDKSTHAYGDKSFLEGSSMFQSFKNLNNEIDIIKSYPQVKAVIQELDFIFTYYMKGNVRDVELYNTAPFQIDTDSGMIVTNVPIRIRFIDQDFYELSMGFGQVSLYDPLIDKYSDTLVGPVSRKNEKHRFGEKIQIGLFGFTLNKTFYASQMKPGDEFYIIGRDINSLVQEYKNKVQIALKSEKSSILKITSSGPSVAKEVAFINKLNEVYIKRQLREKNQIATNTINFIDSQLGVISDSLHLTENHLQSFKTTHKVYDIGENAKSLFGKLADLENRKLSLELENKYYEYINNYITSENDLTDLVAPSTIGIKDNILNQMVSTLVALYEERKSLQYTSSEKSPAYQTILLRIKSAKEALLENSNDILKSTKYSLADMQNRINEVEKELEMVPQQERDYQDIFRRYTINDNIYNYLLQKRAEASIARASNLSDATIIDYARTDEAMQIAPKPGSIYSTYFGTAFAISVVLIIVYSFFDNKVQMKEDIDKATGIPVIGAIEQVDMQDTEKLVYGKYNSLTESFRSIRTNLQFYLKGKPSFIIGITSCISGDGKSFCSLNLARIYAIGGKKTLLICGDLRKKMDNTKYNIPIGGKGLSEYLIGVAKITEIVHKGEIDHLYIIPSGPMPPNSSELLASEKTKLFIEEIKKQYDVIVFDSPPVGLVSDYVSIMDYVDINLYVIRYNHTPKLSMEVLDYLKTKTGSDTSHAVIFNGIKESVMAKYSYAYGYIYNYGYDGTASPRRKWWQKIFLRKKTKKAA